MDQKSIQKIIQNEQGYNDWQSVAGTSSGEEILKFSEFLVDLKQQTVPLTAALFVLREQLISGLFRSLFVLITQVRHSSTQ